MMWYVRVGGRIIGTVIAADEIAAQLLAYVKFHISWEDGPIEVVLRKQSGRKS